MQAYIMIELMSGAQIKYVRDVVADSGAGGQYYQYANTTGNKFANQTGAGKVYGDYQTLITNFEDSNKFLNFPESAGPTKTLSRPNLEQGLGKGGYNSCYIAKQSIARIFVVERWAMTDNML